MLERYQIDIGPLKAKIVFIDSNKPTLTGKYNGYDVYNVKDIGGLALDEIIISSSLYEDEMYRKVQELYGNKFRVRRFYEKGNKDIFLVKGNYLGVDIKNLKVLKINFADVWQEFDYGQNIFVNLLCSKYRLEISDSPDILFCSYFGEAHKNYKDCIKVFYETEVIPFNFNDYDYAIGFQYLNDRRFCRYDVYMPSDSEIVIQNRKGYSDISLAKRKFCNFVYSNESWGEGAVLRKQFCLELAKYKHIDCPGRSLNNMKNAITSRNSEEWRVGKREFIGQYKFTIAFENHKADGYTTEKLWDPFRVGSIPIYWGNSLVNQMVDSEAFINCNDFDNDFDAVIQRVKEIDIDDEYYMHMIQKSPIKSSYDPGFESLECFIDKIALEALER